MIGCFDTSALVPLVIAEPGSIRCSELWNACDQRLASMLVIAEGHAALAQALRLERLTPDEHENAAALLDLRIGELDLVLPARQIVDSAAKLALQFGLRGYDAVHAATALSLSEDDVVAITADTDLLKALKALGISTADPNNRPSATASQNRPARR